MAEIISYPEKSILSENDYLLISDSQNSYITKKTKVSDINAIAPAAVKYWYLGSGSGSTTGLISNPDGSSQNIASGEYSVATNYNNTASGKWSFAAGERNVASGEASATFGINNTASGDWSMAIGRATVASGDRAFAQGASNEASSDYSVALNFDTLAAGLMSTATGRSTKTYGQNSASFGYMTKTYGTNSVVMGDNTIAYDYGSLVIGKFNLSGSTVTADRYNFNIANTAFVIGNGTSARSDAFKVMFNGNTTVGNNLILSSYGSGTKTGTATQKLAVDTNGNVIELPIGSGPVDGSGTANYLTKWIDSDTIGNSIAYDSGSQLLLNATSSSTTANSKLYVEGDTWITGAYRLGNIGSTSQVGKLVIENSILALESSYPIQFKSGNNTYVHIGDYVLGGKIGIGTTNPTQKVVIKKSGFGSVNIGATTASGATLLAAGNNEDYGTFFATQHSSDNYTGLIQQRRRSAATFYNLALNPYGGNVGIGTTSPSNPLTVVGVDSIGIDDYILHNGDSNTKFGFPSNDTFKIRTSGTDRFNINSSGNVGIGTTSPNYRLTVYGSSTDSEIVASFASANNGGEYTAIGLSGYIDNNGATKAGIALKRTSTYGTGEFHFLNNNTLDNSDMTLSDSKMMINSSGDVGIGTTSPNRKLVIKSSGADDGINLRRSSNNAVIATLIETGGGDGALLLATNTGVTKTLLRGNGNNYINGGNLGVGTTSPQAKLDISSTGTGDSMIIRNDDASSSAAPVLMLLRDSASAANGDYLGQIKFKGNSDTGAERVYAKITAKISDATNGAEDSLIETAVRDNGSNLIVSRQTHQNLKLINGIGLESDGDVYIPTIGKGLIIKSPNGTRYRITVDNSGNLGTELA